MRYFLIDGFNMIHKIPQLVSASKPHTALINYIKHNKLAGSIRNKVTIIFDGSIDYDAINEKEFTIRFSLDKSADDLIKAKIEGFTNKTLLTVVSDDRDLIDFSKRHGAVSLAVKEFAHLNTQKRASSGRAASQSGHSQDKDIPYLTQREITEELKKLWLKE